MGAHLIDGEFQSDKYPTCPRGKVPLSVKDPTAQGLLWEYAQRRRAVDAEFSDDLETALRAAGYVDDDLIHDLFGKLAGWVVREAVRLRDGDTELAEFKIRLCQPQGEVDGTLYLEYTIDESTSTDRSGNVVSGVAFDDRPVSELLSEHDATPG